MTRIVVVGLVGIHLLVAIWHGGAHTELAIELSPEQNLFVYVGVLLAPIVAAGLVWTRYSSAGLWLFMFSMLASHLFGVYHHYVLVSPDNIGHLPAATDFAHSRFINSAGILALIELLSALVGAFFVGSRYGQSRRHHS